MKTVLVEGVGWPEVGEWPVEEKPKFKHAQKPVRVIKPKAKPKPKPAPVPVPAPKAEAVCEVVVNEGVFMHPRGNKVRRNK